MKIVFLNVWNNELAEKISGFISEQISSTDVFCFQETADSFKTDNRLILQDFEISSCRKPINENLNFNQGTYVKNDYTDIAFEAILESTPHLGVGIYCCLRHGNQQIHITNFHGTAFPDEKLDSSERIEQSEFLIDFFKDKKGPKIIGGDFNLEPETQSVKLFEKGGYRNLIKEYGIKTTRNKLAWVYTKKLYFSDYIFVSPEVKVKNFEVLNLEISDHLPLILEL